MKGTTKSFVLGVVVGVIAYHAYQTTMANKAV